MKIHLKFLLTVYLLIGKKKKVQLNSFSSFLTGLSESKDWSVYRAADAIPSRVPAAAPDSGLSQR